MVLCGYLTIWRALGRDRGQDRHYRARRTPSGNSVAGGGYWLRQDDGWEVRGVVRRRCSFESETESEQQIMMSYDNIVQYDVRVKEFREEDGRF